MDFVTDACNGAIAHWVAPKNTVLREILKRCEFFLDGEKLIMNIPNSLADFILADAGIFARLREIEVVEIKKDGETLTNVSPQKLMEYLKTHDPELYFSLLEQAEYRPYTIVRMRDNKILYASQEVAVTGTKANDMLGKNSRDWWIDDDYWKFIDALETHGAITSYSYRALLMANNQPAHFTVDARRTQWRGDDVRIVELLSTEPT